MKMNKLLLLSVLSLGLLMGCTGNNNPSQSGGNSGNESESDNPSSSSSEPIIEKKVTVNFYLDYNHVSNDQIIFTTQVDNGGLISEKPTNPTEAPYPEFPVFKGWSKKEIIDDINDLWNFESDIVIANSGVFSLYGIWVAEGE